MRPMETEERVNKQREGSKYVRRLTVALTGVSAAAVVVAFNNHPDSMAITIGSFLTFLLVFRLADPGRYPS